MYSIYLSTADFYAPISKDREAYCFTVVCLSVCHIWYEGISHQYASAGTKVKVICKGQGQI